MSILVIRPDDLLKQGPGRWNRDDVAEAWAECARRLRAALLDPAVLVVGPMVGAPGSGKTTWSDRVERDGWVLHDAVWANPRRRAKLAARIRRAGKRPVAVHVVTPLALCLARNDARPPWRRVPEATLRRDALQIRLWPPSWREGWDAVEVVDGTAVLS